MRILVTGARGQLGYDVVNELIKKGHTPIGVGLEEMDITDSESVRSVITASQVDGVIHCAAYTAVDKAEEEAELCRKVNVDGTRNIAEVCQALDLKMIYISTDYVFSGEGESPFQVDDPKEPTNVYGITKLAGELEVTSRVKKHYIVRIAWVFGLNGNNFVKTMLRLGKQLPEVKVVNDQIGSPTYCFDVARLLVELIESDNYGIYHATNEGYCSWFEFAKEIFRYSNLSVKVTGITSDQFITKATRPKNSRLDKSKLDQAGFSRLPSWQDALHRYLDLLNQ